MTELCQKLLEKDLKGGRIILLLFQSNKLFCYLSHKLPPEKHPSTIYKRFVKIRLKNGKYKSEFDDSIQRKRLILSQNKLNGKNWIKINTLEHASSKWRITSV
jgi:hypothetical protein